MSLIILGDGFSRGVTAKLDQLLAEMRMVMGALETVQAYAARLETALSGLRTDVQALKDALANADLSQEAKDVLESITSRFEAFDSEQ